MALTETSVTRAVDASGDEIKTYTDADGDHVQAIGLADEAGDHTGIQANPAEFSSETLRLILESVLTELQEMNTHLRILTEFDNE